MLRHSLRFFLGQLGKERQRNGLDTEKIQEATKFLNDLEFHKRLRNGFISQFFDRLLSDMIEKTNCKK